MNSTGNFVTQSIIFFDYNEFKDLPLISDQVRSIVEPALWFAMLILNVMGVVTNVINIRVFIEQGVKNDSTNIGFLCLSVSDLLACATLIPHALCTIVIYTDGLAKYLTCNAFAIPFGYGHVALQNMSTWITVYISLIRTLCVLFPLKVKLMFTPRLTTIVVLSIFVFFLAVQLTYAVNTTLVWVFEPIFNATIAYVLDSPLSQIVVYYHQLITNQISPGLAVIILSINSLLMTHKLIQVKKWRVKNTSDPSTLAKEDQTSKSTDPTKMASKDIELIKFINTTAGIFLVCNLMGFIPGVAVMVFPDVSFNGINKNLFFITFFVRFLFDSINASINFFFYIRVSSRYKAAFATAFNIRLIQDEKETQ